MLLFHLYWVGVRYIVPLLVALKDIVDHNFRGSPGAFRPLTGVEVGLNNVCFRSCKQIRQIWDTNIIYITNKAIMSLPFSVFVRRVGVCVNVCTGVLSTQELWGGPCRRERSWLPFRAPRCLRFPRGWRTRTYCFLKYLLHLFYGACTIFSTSSSINNKNFEDSMYMCLT